MIELFCRGEGNSWVIEVFENFLNSLKTELFHYCKFKTRGGIEYKIFEYSRYSTIGADFIPLMTIYHQ